MRIYELAKKYNKPSKELVALLNDEFDLGIKSHMSVIEGDDLDLIIEFLEEEKREEKDDYEEYEQVEKIKKSKINKKQSQGKKDRDPEIKDKAKVNNKKNSNKNKNKDKSENKKEANKIKDKSAIEIPENIVVKDLAEALNLSLGQVMGELIKNGVMANQNQSVDFDTAELIALSFNKEIQHKKEEEKEDLFEGLDFEDKEEDLEVRPPVVTVMGHVDHGKTSLLDAIRKTDVTKGEAGGITQHIGASVSFVNGKKIVFLDTPGHEAFTQMRMRGAQSTDIAILVVAADDGVMPQTVEAINHAKAANVPIIVAINKIDKYEANPERVKQELAEHGLMPEDWGGDTVMLPVSALNGQGIDDLLEMILMIAELQELKANPNRKALGLVIEAYLDKGLGPVATVLVQKGTLRLGDAVVTGTVSGKIRAMYDSKGNNIKSAKPSNPALITGLSEVPEAGDKIFVVDDEKIARNIAEKQKEIEKDTQIEKSSNINLDELFNKIEDGDVQDLNIIVKTDVKGTIDAVQGSFSKLSNEQVKVNIIHSAVGGINESDVMLASASNAIVIGFNVRPNQTAINQAENLGVEIRTYRVIYEAIEDVEKAIKGMLAPTFKEYVLGRLEVREVFRVPNVGNIAGVYVTSGKITRHAGVRLLRNDIVIHEGSVSSLKRYKDDVKELNQGYEGGVGIENYNDIKQGDIIEAFEMREV